MDIRDQILSRDDIETREIWVPEWGTKVFVRGMTGQEREKFERLSQAVQEKGTVRALLAVLSCRDEEGNRIFRDDDVDALAAKNVAPLARIYEAAKSLSKITQEDIEELEGK